MHRGPPPWERYARSVCGRLRNSGSTLTQNAKNATQGAQKQGAQKQGAQKQGAQKQGVHKQGARKPVQGARSLLKGAHEAGPVSSGDEAEEADATVVTAYATGTRKRRRSGGVTASKSAQGPAVPNTRANTPAACAALPGAVDLSEAAASNSGGELFGTWGSAAHGTGPFAHQFDPVDMATRLRAFTYRTLRLAAGHNGDSTDSSVQMVSCSECDAVLDKYVCGICGRPFEMHNPLAEDHFPASIVHFDKIIRSNVCHIHGRTSECIRMLTQSVHTFYGVVVPLCARAAASGRVCGEPEFRAFADHRAQATDSAHVAEAAAECAPPHKMTRTRPAPSGARTAANSKSRAHLNGEHVDAVAVASAHQVSTASGRPDPHCNRVAVAKDCGSEGDTEANEAAEFARKAESEAGSAAEVLLESAAGCNGAALRLCFLDMNAASAMYMHCGDLEALVAMPADDILATPCGEHVVAAFRDLASMYAEPFAHYQQRAAQGRGGKAGANRRFPAGGQGPSCVHEAAAQVFMGFALETEFGTSVQILLKAKYIELSKRFPYFVHGPGAGVPVLVQGDDEFVQIVGAKKHSLSTKKLLGTTGKDVGLIAFAFRHFMVHLYGAVDGRPKTVRKWHRVRAETRAGNEGNNGNGDMPTGAESTCRSAAAEGSSAGLARSSTGVEHGSAGPECLADNGGERMGVGGELAYSSIGEMGHRAIPAPTGFAEVLFGREDADRDGGLRATAERGGQCLASAQVRRTNRQLIAMLISKLHAKTMASVENCQLSHQGAAVLVFPNDFTMTAAGPVVNVSLHPSTLLAAVYAPSGLLEGVVVNPVVENMDRDICPIKMLRKLYQVCDSLNSNVRRMRSYSLILSESFRLEEFERIAAEQQPMSRRRRCPVTTCEPEDLST